MLIDCHHHYLLNEKEYLQKLVEECTRLRMDKVCLLASGEEMGIADNEMVKDACDRYPDLFIGFGYVKLGVDGPHVVDDLHSQGFRGIKVTRPKYNYDDKRFYPIYAKAAILSMPILFHVGTVMRTPTDEFFDVSCDRMRPIYLDTIARAFPKLTVIGAHLGNPWYEEASMTLFWNPNIYFDLSGSTLKRKGADFFRETLWWMGDTLKRLARDPERSWYREAFNKHPFEKILFGTDVPYYEVEQVVNEYEKVLTDMNLSSDLKKKVFGETMARLLGL